MTGILMESLTLYERVIGDERILPAIEKALAWTWSTQWVEEKEGFRYHSIKETDAIAALNGLILPAWGYAYSKTGKVQYLEQGNKIARGAGGERLQGNVGREAIQPVSSDRPPSSRATSP